MDVERALIDSIAHGARPFADAVDAFVGQLLHETGFSRRPTDGVLFAWEQVGNGVGRGAGFVVMIDGQLVQPLRVEFSVDANSTSIASGAVHFGLSGSPGVPYEGPEHRRMRKLMLADPNCEWPWARRFVADAAGWRSDPIGEEDSA